jgi:pimeloyl-ACP methyl ester carboxylesterase
VDGETAEIETHPMREARAMLARARRRTLPLPARGVSLALLDWGGDGPLALLHHATGFCKGVWGPVAEALRAHFHVISLDARGHGDSTLVEGFAPYAWREFGADLAAAVEALAREHGPVALGIGHSFGGTAMLVASRLHPDLLRRVVLVDPVMPPPPAPLPPASAARSNPLAEGARRRRTEWPSLAAARESWGQRTVFKTWRPEVLDLYALDGLREHADGSVTLKCPSAVEAAIFDQGRDLDAMAIADGHPTPTLWIRADRGNFDAEWCRTLAGSMRACELRDLAVGHLVVMEEPEIVVRETLRFAGF